MLPKQISFQPQIFPSRVFFSKNLIALDRLKIYCILQNMALARMEGFRSGVLRVAHTAVERVHPTALSVFDVDKLKAEEQVKGYIMLSGDTRAVLCVSYKPKDSQVVFEDIAIGEVGLGHDTRVTIAGSATENSAILDLYSPHRASIDRILNSSAQNNGGHLDESALDNDMKDELSLQRDYLARDSKAMANDSLKDRKHLLKRMDIDPQDVLRVSWLVKTNGWIRE